MGYLCAHALVWVTYCARWPPLDIDIRVFTQRSSRLVSSLGRLANCSASLYVCPGQIIRIARFCTLSRSRFCILSTSRNLWRLARVIDVMPDSIISLGENQNCYVDSRIPNCQVSVFVRERTRPEKIPIGRPIILNSLIHRLNENNNL